MKLSVRLVWCYACGAVLTILGILLWMTGHRWWGWYPSSFSNRIPASVLPVVISAFGLALIVLPQAILRAIEVRLSNELTFDLEPESSSKTGRLLRRLLELQFIVTFLTLATIVATFQILRLDSAAAKEWSERHAFGHLARTIALYAPTTAVRSSWAAHRYYLDQDPRAMQRGSEDFLWTVQLLEASNTFDVLGSGHQSVAPGLPLTVRDGPEILFHASDPKTLTAEQRRDIGTAAAYVGRVLALDSRDGFYEPNVALAEHFFSYALAADSSLAVARNGLGVCLLGKMKKGIRQLSPGDDLPVETTDSACRALDCFQRVVHTAPQRLLVARARNNILDLRMHLAYLLHIHGSHVPRHLMLGVDAISLYEQLVNPTIFDSMLAEARDLSQSFQTEPQFTVTYAQALCGKAEYLLRAPGVSAPRGREARRLVLEASHMLSDGNMAAIAGDMCDILKDKHESSVMMLGVFQRSAFRKERDDVLFRLNAMRGGGR